MFRRRRSSNDSSSKGGAAEPAVVAAAPAAAPPPAADTTPLASSPTSLTSSSSSSSHQQQQQASSALGALGLPPVGEWPQFPVYVRLSPRPLPPTDGSSSAPSAPTALPQQRRRDGQPQGAPVPFNSLERVPFETELFEGEIVLNMAGLGPAPPPAWADTHGRGYFTGCAEGRTLECAVQGRFKRRLRFDEVYTGQAFTTPLQRLPPRFMVRAVEAVVRRLAPATQLDVTGDRPFIMGPLATVAAVMRVSDPANGDPSPDIMTLCEDTAALGGPFAPPPPPPTAPVRKRRSGSFGSGSGVGGGWFGRRMTAGAWGSDEGGGKGGSAPLPLHRDRMARRKFFADAAKLRSYYFEPGLVYGFGFFGSAWRVDAWQLNVAGLTSIDLATYVHPTQALQIMARLKDRDELLWALEVWNAKALLSPDALALAAAAHKHHHQQQLQQQQQQQQQRAQEEATQEQEPQGQQEVGEDGEGDDTTTALAAAVEGLGVEEQGQEPGQQQEEKAQSPLKRLAGLFSPSPRNGSR